MDLPVYELAALGAALCWALTGLMVAPPLQRLGTFAFNCYRQVLTALVLVLIVGATYLAWRDTFGDASVPPPLVQAFEA